MKVLFITVRSDFGGGPRHVDQLINRMPDNVDVYVAYPEIGDPYADEWRNNSKIKGRIFIPYRKFSLKTLLRIKNYIKENGIDIVHSHGNGAGFYSRMLKIVGCKAKIVHTFHGVTNNYTSKIKWFLNVCLGRFFCLFTDEFILVSKGEYILAKKLFFLKPIKSTVVYNGIDNPAITANADGNVFTVVSLSRFDYQKNMDMSFEVARKLKNENIRFVWVGNGDDWSRLKAASEKESLNIDFVGFSKTPMLYLSKSNVYLSTSRFEGMPYALIEAASVGLPIVATNVTGNNEVVLDQENGFLVENVEETCNALRKLKADQNMQQRMSKASKNFFYSNFTIENMIDKIVRIYQN